MATARSAPPAADPYAALDGALRELAQRGVLKRYRKNTLLIQEDDIGDAMYIVLSGSVKAFSVDDRFREIVYGRYGAGDYFGEMSLDGGPRSASVMTLETTTCVTVTRHTVLTFLADHPEFTRELLSRIIRRARLATRSARSMALLSVYQRVTQLFADIAVDLGDGTRLIEPSMTQAELAARVGCAREMISRVMTGLVSGGYLRVDGRRWVLAGKFPKNW